VQKAWDGKARDGKARDGKARDGKARDGPGLWYKVVFIIGVIVGAVSMEDSTVEESRTVERFAL